MGDLHKQTTTEKGGKRRYKPVSELAKEGKISLVEPLDYLIMDTIQDEGTMLGEFYPLGTTVRDLVQNQFKGLDSDMISGRLRAMEQYGLTQHVQMPGARGWQTTKMGQEWLTEWKRNRNGKENA